MSMSTKDYTSIVLALATARRGCIYSPDKSERVPKLSGWYITVGQIRSAVELSYERFSADSFYSAIGYYRGMNP